MLRIFARTMASTSSTPGQNYIEVLANVNRLGEAVGRPVTLVAVSKTKPVELLREVYDAGCRTFGENYVQELVAKSAELPNDIEWHFIGDLQTNKVKDLIHVPNLLVETVDSIKLANTLQKACVNNGRTNLPIYIQVNTSNEDSKNGVDRSGFMELVQAVTEKCPALTLKGFMTIGAPNPPPEQPDFVLLAELRRTAAEFLGREESAFALSMGMSADYDKAIEFGSTSVRVGSTIFGAREAKGSSHSSAAVKVEGGGAAAGTAGTAGGAGADVPSAASTAV